MPPPNSDDESYRKTIVSLAQQIHSLQTEMNTWHRIVGELIRDRLVPIEAAALLAKFDEYREQERVGSLLEIERTQPWFAAMLDAANPLLPENDEPDQPGH